LIDRLFLVPCLLIAATGCQDDNKAANLPRPADDWQPEQRLNEDVVFVAPERSGAEFKVAEQADDPSAVYTVDAMVGQINGRPLYASTVFKDIGEQTLETMAANKPKAEFVRELYDLLRATLGQQITDALVLAEAQASLTDRERAGLLDILRQFREDLISKAGGTLALAEERMRRERGIDLEEAVEQQRQRILVSKYMQDKLYPRVHVSRHEVERFYEENDEMFNPKPRITVQVILARGDAIARQVIDALAAGKSFEQVGEMRDIRLSELEHSGGPETFDGLAWPQANEAVRGLSEGESVGPVEVSIGQVWLRLHEVRTGESKSLQEVYLAIEKRLRAQKFDRLNRQYMANLLRQGNYTDIDLMLDALVEVAVNRYAAGG